MIYEQTLSLTIMFNALDKEINKLRKNAKSTVTLQLKIEALNKVRQLEKERSRLRMCGFEIEDMIAGRK